MNCQPYIPRKLQNTGTVADFILIAIINAPSKRKCKTPNSRVPCDTLDPVFLHAIIGNYRLGKPVGAQAQCAPGWWSLSGRSMLRLTSAHRHRHLSGLNFEGVRHRPHWTVHLERRQIDRRGRDKFHCVIRNRYRQGPSCRRHRHNRTFVERSNRGQITELKLVKRQMFGNRKLDLLQARLIDSN